jgi:2-polyprenyl-3-methyl-5-hydroxy-6-metoxy-1,4-benzoquinol methylase
VPIDAAPAAGFYDHVWSRYAQLDAKSPAARHRRRLLIDRVTATLATRPEFPRPRLLDAGMGPGHLLRELAAALPTLELAGGDVSPRGLELARRAGAPGELFPLDLSAPRFNEAYAEHIARYDIVVCSEVLEHLSDDRAAVGHLRDLLAPGGTLLVTVPSGKPTRFDLRIGHLRHYSKRQLATLLAEQGLRPESVVAWGFPFHSAYRAAVRVAAAWHLRDSADATAAEADNDPDAFDRPSGVRDLDSPRAFLEGVDDAPVTELGAALAGAYGAAAWLLDPLFFLNLPWGGEQLVAVARERE